MTYKLKALSVALIVALAIAALSGTAANAEQFHAGSHGTSKGINVGEETFTTNAGTVKCKTAEYNETFFMFTTMNWKTVAPTYFGCTAFGFVGATVDTNTCRFEFGTPISTTSTVNIGNCVTPITVTAFNCYVTIGNQNNLGHVVWSNQGTTFPVHVQASSTISGITYTQHSKSFPGCTNGTFKNGTFVGATTYKAYDTSGAQTSLMVT